MLVEEDIVLKAVEDWKGPINGGVDHTAGEYTVAAWGLRGRNAFLRNASIVISTTSTISSVVGVDIGSGTTSGVVRECVPT